MEFRRMKRLLIKVTAVFGVLVIGLCFSGASVNAVASDTDSRTPRYAVITYSDDDLLGTAESDMDRSSINENGVRLRKAASTSSIVLELMYKGETVEILSYVNSSWAHIVRLSTGTRGYVKRTYLNL